MPNLSTSAIEGLKAKGYSQAQVDAIAKASETGGITEAQKVVAGFGTVKPIVVSRSAGPESAIVAPVKPASQTMVPVTTAPITQAQLDGLNPVQKAAVKSMLTSGDKTGAQKAAISYVAENAKPKAVTVAPVARIIPSTTPGATAAVSYVNAVRKKNVPSIIKKESVSPVEAPGILSQTEAQLAETKRQTLVDEKAKDVSAATEKLNKGIAVIKTNSDAVRNLYGVDANGNVDMNNKESLAYKINSGLDNFKTEKNKLLSQTESSQLNRVQGTMRSTLASRGIDASKVAPELLMSLSGELGINAFDSIAKLRESTVNSILGEEKSALEKISLLREKGLASENDAKIAVETLRSTVEDSIRAVNKQFANDVIGVASGEITRKKTESSDVLNSVTKFGAALGLSGTGMSAVNSYLSKFADPAAAVKSMLSDLTNKSSELYKQVGAVEAAKIAAAQNEYALKLLAAEADVERAKKSGEKKPFKLSASDAAAVAAVLGKPVSEVTAEDFDKAMKENPEFRNKYAKDTVTASTSGPATEGVTWSGSGPITVSGSNFTVGAKNKSGMRPIYGEGRQIVSDYMVGPDGKLVKVK